uniref:(northern house mosquito) hypothetical protein n=1 Tax=Culex pipiens TaxID=7175 RepID=A0A8D8KP51_CULPI
MDTIKTNIASLCEVACDYFQFVSWFVPNRSWFVKNNHHVIFGQNHLLNEMSFVNLYKLIVIVVNLVDIVVVFRVFGFLFISSATTTTAVFIFVARYILITTFSIYRFRIRLFHLLCTCLIPSEFHRWITQLQSINTENLREW